MTEIADMHHLGIARDRPLQSMSPAEVMQAEKHRQHLIALIKRWLPASIKPLFDELLG